MSDEESLNVWAEYSDQLQGEFQPQYDAVGSRPSFRKVRAGYAELPSYSVSSSNLPVVRDTLALDVKVPADAQGWIGDVQMSVGVRAAGLGDTYLGYNSLDSLPRGEWTTIQFSVPQDVRQVLDDNVPGVEIRTFVNTGVEGVSLRNLRTEGVERNFERLPHSPRLVNVATTAFLSFEEETAWQGFMTEEGRLFPSEGARYLSATSGGYVELRSRDFSAADIPEVTDTLALDIWVPHPLPNPYWLGDVQVYLSCPDARLWNRWLGRLDLAQFFPQAWNTATLDLSPDVENALRDASACSFSIAMNTASDPTNSGFGIDRVGFVQ